MSLHSESSFWYKTLYEKDEVYEKICACYGEKMVPYLDLLLSEKIDEYKMYLDASAAMNDIRWKVDLDNNPYYTNRDAAFYTLKQYMAERKKFLDNTWK